MHPGGYMLSLNALLKLEYLVLRHELQKLFAHWRSEKKRVQTGFFLSITL
jgi:hypothetical protein